MQTSLTVAAIALAAYAAMLGWIYVRQESLLFYPTPPDLALQCLLRGNLAGVSERLQLAGNRHSPAPAERLVSV